MTDASPAMPASFPPELGKLISLLRNRNGILAAECDEDVLEGFAERLEAAAWGYPCKIELINPHDIDRLGDFMIGPAYTSTEYPWPTDEDGAPMAPLLQLNLERASALGNIDLGSGLLQVWMPDRKCAPEDQYLRVIPREDVSANRMTPVIQELRSSEHLLCDVTQWVADYHAPNKELLLPFMNRHAQAQGYKDSGDLEGKNDSEWSRIRDEYGDQLQRCVQITGYASVELYISLGADSEQMIRRLARKNPKVRPADQEAAARWDEMVEALELCQAIQRLAANNTFPCLFGTFNFIQYYARDEGRALLCMEALDGRDWGDGGNCQIFRGTDFYLKWSCT